jgi:hypothetical protein
MEVAGRVRSAFLLIQQVQVEIHLAGMFRLERNDFHVKDHEGLEEAVVEERVNEIFFAAKNEAVLPADKAEAIAELQNEPLQVRGEPTYL